MVKVLSVNGLNNYIKAIFEYNTELTNVTVKGEISNFVRHSSGTLYFSLKDESSQIRCIMFKNGASELDFKPETGTKVVLQGSVSVYTKTGDYQIYVRKMKRDGLGDLFVEFERLKKKLNEEGLFSSEHKKAIPSFPQRIGVITSPTGAAVQDIRNVISRRAPAVQLILYPAVVQGDGTEKSLIAGLDYFDREQNVDCVIIGRGGGSMEDLWGFNSEKLIRRIYDFTLPIISGTGHDIDHTLTDYVCDAFGPTPSAAAELAVPNYEDLKLRVSTLSNKAKQLFSVRVSSMDENFKQFVSVSRVTNLDTVFSAKKAVLTKITSSVQQNLNKRLEPARKELVTLDNRVRTLLSERFWTNLQTKVNSFAMRTRQTLITEYTAKEGGLGRVSDKLLGINPLAVLSRGYSVATKQNGNVIKSIQDVSKDEKITIKISDGEIKAVVENVEH